MKKATLGVVFDGNSLRIPVEDGEKALKDALGDPTIPKEVRGWVAENLSALTALVRAYTPAFRDTWIRIPLDGEWTWTFV